MKKIMSRLSLFSLVGILLIATFSFLFTFTGPAQNVSAGAPTCTWVGAGGNDNWSTASNWTCESGTTPVDGTALIFPYDNADDVDYTVSNNDLSASNTYSGIEFSGSCSFVGSSTYNYRKYNITGNALKVAGDILADMPQHVDAHDYDCTPMFDADIAMTADATLYRLNTRGGLAVSTHVMTLNDVQVDSGLSGSGAITTIGYVSYGQHNPSFTGTTTVTNGQLLLWEADSAGASSAQILLGAGGSLGMAQGITVPNNITVLSGADAQAIRASFQSGDSVGPEYDTYAKNCSDDSTGCSSTGVMNVTFSGTITLQQNASVHTSQGAFQFTGPIVGNGHSFTLFDPNTPNNGSFGDLILASSANTSTTPNGTYHSTPYTSTLSDTTSQGLIIGILNTVILNGQRGETQVSKGALGGMGTVGMLYVQSGGTINPGPDNSGLGTLNSAGLLISSGGIYRADLGGTGAGQFDQINVTGTVRLGYNSESTHTILQTHLVNGYTPTLNDTFMIVKNDGSDAVEYQFDDLAEGATFVSEDVTYTISYIGGDGNDVTLTATTVPGAPDTAGVLARSANILLPLGAIVIAGAVLLVRQRSKVLYKNRK